MLRYLNNATMYGILSYPHKFVHSQDQQRVRHTYTKLACAIKRIIAYCTELIVWLYLRSYGIRAYVRNHMYLLRYRMLYSRIGREERSKPAPMQREISISRNEIAKHLLHEPTVILFRFGFLFTRNDNRKQNMHCI